MSPYRTCIDCPAPVKLGHRDRCHVCHRRAERAAQKRSCTNCLQLRHLGPGDVCASCVHAAAPPKAPKTIRCISCDQQRRNVGHGLCNRCNLADLDRPFNYAAAQARKMSPVPEWWNDLTAFVAARHHPGGAVAVLRATGRILAADPTASPHRLLTCSAGEGSTNRALTAFFISRGLALSGDREQRAAAQRRARYLDAVPAALAAGVAAFNRALLDERERARRRGRRPLSDITVETKLRILRDLATSLTTLRHVTGWAEITTADLEDWIAKTPTRRHQLTYVLRGFFAWAKNAKLVLVDPTGPLRLSVQPAFNGAIIDTAAQRTLLRRWTTAGTHPHERLVGLLALLHAASNAQIRSLVVADIDPQHRTANLAGRPFPTPLDPATWAAVDASLRHREALHTLNPHLIVTGSTRTRGTAPDSSYVSRRLAPAATTPSACRQTRLADLVTSLDPKLTAAALGMNGSGLVRYLDDNIANDRLATATRRV